MTTITIMADEGPLVFGFEDLVRYHGHGALAMLAITFRAQQEALARLCADTPPRREMIEIVSGHPGPGVRDAFEMVTRCVTRGAYKVEKTLPGPRLNAATDVVYAFQISVAGCGRQHVALRPGILPPEFFALLGATAEQDRKAAFALRRRLATEFLVLPADQLFILG